jgi:hypothetical protein
LFDVLLDEQLGQVLFGTGYLSCYFPCLLDVLLVNKRFFNVGRRYIRAVSTEANERVTALWLCKTLPSMVPNLTALRLDYLFPLRTGEDPSTSSLSASSMQQHQECFPAAQELQELCNSLAPTLQRLSLRGTALDDDGMLSLVQLKNLELLDLSKSSRAHAPLITDAGVRNLVSSRGGGVAASLLWLNLAMTRVTDEAVQSISTYMPRLRHLGLQCCSLLTDDCFEWLEGLGLHSLDVTSCPLLTNDAFFRLGSKRSLCRPVLSVLLASYLPNCTGELLALFLAKFERLRVLEFKRKEALANEALLPPLDMRLEAKQRLAVAVFLHGDLDAIKLRGGDAYQSVSMYMPDAGWSSEGW